MRVTTAAEMRELDRLAIVPDAARFHGDLWRGRTDEDARGARGGGALNDTWELRRSANRQPS